MKAQRKQSRGGRRTKMGRPKGTGGPPELVRGNRVTATFTDAELKQLTRLADGKGLPVGRMLYELVKRRVKPQK